MEDTANALISALFFYCIARVLVGLFYRSAKSKPHSLGAFIWLFFLGGCVSHGIARDPGAAHGMLIVWFIFGFLPACLSIRQKIATALDEEKKKEGARRERKPRRQGHARGDTRRKKKASPPDWLNFIN